MSDILQQKAEKYEIICSKYSIITILLVNYNIMFYYIIKIAIITEVERMDRLKKLKYDIDTLCIYDLKDDIVVRSLYDLLCNVDNENVLKMQSSFFRLIANEKSMKEHISRCILEHDNVFTKAICADTADKLDKTIIDAVKEDLKKLEEISNITADDICSFVQDDDLREILKTIPQWKIGSPLFPLAEKWDQQLDALIAFHKTSGYGMYAKHIAFTWRNNDIVPISTTNKIRLEDLKNYQLQREQVIENTLAFLHGFPANNVLLYGDRGTGKSSTIHAILNEYNTMGLRMIEISKSDISDLTMIRERIAESPMKFIIYIDDLSFDSHEDSFGALKAALEGSLSGRQSNTLIYATSNRRHLIKENFSDRENDVNRSDTLQEELSLSDRFGLSITFLNPTKQEDFFDIVTKIALDRDFDVDIDTLCQKADQWARRRGGRSPRCAKQFVDYVEGCVKRNKSW